MEERRVKRVTYVAEMPSTSDPDEKWQLTHNFHEETKRRLQRRNILPLTIIVTPNIAKCKDVADELQAFLVEAEHITPELADDRVLVLQSHLEEKGGRMA